MIVMRMMIYNDNMTKNEQSYTHTYIYICIQYTDFFFVYLHIICVAMYILIIIEFVRDSERLDLVRPRSF